MWISTKDLARVGQLMLNKGYWNDKEIIPKIWIEESTKPCPLASNYGCLWLIKDPKNGLFPSAPQSAFFAMCVGIQVIYVDLENDIVIIVRRMEKDKVTKFIRLVLESLTP